jgi:hypothetical protein
MKKLFAKPAMSRYSKASLAVLRTTLITWALSGTTFAGPFEDATAAYDRADYATALRLYRPLADRGNARAQILIGLMYDEGKGVRQDYAKAASWYRKAPGLFPYWFWFHLTKLRAGPPCRPARRLQRIATGIILFVNLTESPKMGNVVATRR